jgi:hypothetical protein
MKKIQINLKKGKKKKKTIPPHTHIQRKTTNEVGTSNFFPNFLVWKFW